MIRRILAFLVIAWAAGFAVFMLAPGAPASEVVTDAIVVPTGGPGRIDRGLELLARHRARRMLISGVAPEVRPIELAVQYHDRRALFACCVDLGREAVDTRSNAAEIAAWVSAHRYRSVRLVTSSWHLPRARLELRSVLGDDVRLVGDGVPGSPSFGFLVTEYNKLILRRIAILFGMKG